MQPEKRLRKMILSILTHYINLYLYLHPPFCCFSTSISHLHIQFYFHFLPLRAVELSTRLGKAQSITSNERFERSEHTPSLNYKAPSPFTITPCYCKAPSPTTHSHKEWSNLQKRRKQTYVNEVKYYWSLHSLIRNWWCGDLVILYMITPLLLLPIWIIHIYVLHLPHIDHPLILYHILFLSPLIPTLHFPIHTTTFAPQEAWMKEIRIKEKGYCHRYDNIFPLHSTLNPIWLYWDIW